MSTVTVGPLTFRYGSTGHRCRKPPDELARRLFARGGIDNIHINSNVITLAMEPGAHTSGIRELIEELFTYYRPGVEVPTIESFGG